MKIWIVVIKSIVRCQFFHTINHVGVNYERLLLVTVALQTAFRDELVCAQDRPDVVNVKEPFCCKAFAGMQFL